MLAEERFREILKIVEENRTVTVQELTEILHTSESTIRRDLTELHKRGSLIKVHGGAAAIESGGNTRDEALAVRRERNIEEKQKLGRYAAGLVEAEDFVYLDAGSSVDLMIEYLAQPEAVYVTNAIGHAKKLLKKGYEVLLIGGNLKGTTEAIVGAVAVESLKRYNFTKGFFGTNGVHHDAGFTTPDSAEALVKEKAMKQCRKSYILSDSSKIGQISSVTFADLADGIVLTTKLKDLSYQKYNNILEVE